MRELSPLQDALVTILTLLLSLACAYITLYVNKLKAEAEEQTKKIKDKRQRELLLSAIEDVQHLAQTAVKATEQTTAKELRNLIKQGKADRGELLSLGRNVQMQIQDALAPEAKEMIRKNFGNVNQYITNTLESALHDLKAQEKVQSEKVKLIEVRQEEKIEQTETETETTEEA